MKFKWNFPAVKNGEMKGIGQGDIEMFKGHPFESLAREICQNSLDAKLSKSDKPVLVEFQSFDISSCDIPDLENLRQNLRSAEKSKPVQKDKRAAEFYKQATKIADEMFCPMLRISDHNTKGLTGSKSKDDSLPWASLVKNTGFSNKTENSGGSYGVGKAAAFACSYFHTVFYSTLDIEGNEASQGVAKLASYRDENDFVTTGTGYCGKDNNPVFEQLCLQEGYKRENNDSGTDIYIVGFNTLKTDWQKEIVLSVLDSFLFALYKKTLIVKVNDIVISYDTLGNVIQEYCTDKNSTIHNYYKILTSPETKEFEDSNYKGKGCIKLKLLISPELQSHRKVAMIRSTGMRIMEQGKINGQIPFAGILSIEGEEINGYLRRLENPEHTKWEYSRAGEGHKQEAENFVSGFVKFIRNCLDSLIQDDNSLNEIDPGIGDYLPSLENDTGDDEMQDTLSDLPVKEKTKLKPRKIISFTEPSNQDDDIVAEDGNGGSGDKFGIGGNDGKSNGDSEGGNYGTGTDGVGNNSGDKEGDYQGVESKTSLEIRSKRIIPVEKAKGKYKLLFIPAVDCQNASVEIKQAAETELYDIDLVNASVTGQSQISCNTNILNNLIFKTGEKIEIIFSINSLDYSSFEVKCYESKK
jgi:hypothetical protein